MLFWPLLFEIHTEGLCTMCSETDRTVIEPYTGPPVCSRYALGGSARWHLSWQEWTVIRTNAMHWNICRRSPWSFCDFSKFGLGFLEGLGSLFHMFTHNLRFFWGAASLVFVLDWIFYLVGHKPTRQNTKTQQQKQTTKTTNNNKIPKKNKQKAQTTHRNKEQKSTEQKQVKPLGKKCQNCQNKNFTGLWSMSRTTFCPKTTVTGSLTNLWCQKDLTSRSD